MPTTDDASREDFPLGMLSEGVAVVGDDGALTPRNDRMRNLLGALQAQNLSDLPLGNPVMADLAGGEAVVMATPEGPCECRVVTAGGQRWLLALGSSALQRAMGIELAAKRLRVLGRLAGTIVHDLANLLLAGVGVAETLRPHVRDEVEAQALDEMQKGVRQGTVLGRVLATMLAAEARDWRVLELSKIVEDVAAIGRKNAMRRGIELESSQDGDASIRVATAETVQAVMHALLFCGSSGAIAIGVHGSVGVATIADGRERSIARIRIIGSSVTPAACAQAVATLGRGVGMLRAFEMTATDSSGLAHAALAMARCGGEITTAVEDGKLTFEFVWPTVRDASS